VPKRQAERTDLIRLVDRLQVEALQCVHPGEAAARFNRAGDLLLATGDYSSALECYGRAVDALIDGDSVRGGMAICRKIIRVVPQVIRARCTLTWLVIGAGYAGDVLRHAADYVTHADLSGERRRALNQIRLMTSVAPDPAMRVALAECMIALGDDLSADAVLGEVYREKDQGMPREWDAEGLWAQVRKAVVVTPKGAME
jgi:tetratricopeptide (TPR) repeat protein